MARRWTAPFLAALVLASAVARAGKPDPEVDKCVSSAEAAERLRDRAKLLDARKELLQCTREICPGVVRKDCAAWLADVDRSIPTIVVRLRDRAGNDVQARVWIDG